MILTPDLMRCNKFIRSALDIGAIKFSGSRGGQARWGNPRPTGWPDKKNLHQSASCALIKSDKAIILKKTRVKISWRTSFLKPN
jgi:hypothetical protein